MVSYSEDPKAWKYEYNKRYVRKPSAISKDIVQYYITAIESGYLKSGDKLPTTKEVAAQFKTSAEQVIFARRELVRLGLAGTKVGGRDPGTYVI